MLISSIVSSPSIGLDEKATLSSERSTILEAILQPMRVQICCWRIFGLFGGMRRFLILGAWGREVVACTILPSRRLVRLAFLL